MEQAKQMIMSFKPNIKESTLNNYIRTLEQLMRYMDKSDLTFIEDAEPVLDFINNMKNKTGKPISYLTKRNYLNAIIVLLQAQDTPNKELIAQYLKPRDEHHEKYESDQASGTISEKQAPNFATMEELQQMLKDMRGDLSARGIFKKDKLNRDERTSLKAYIIFHFHLDFPIRNELAGIKLIGKREYNKLSEEDKINNNYIINMRPNYELSLGNYKTNKKHGVKIFIIDKQNEILLKKWIRINNIQKGEVIFPMSRTDLSNLLINYSKKSINKRISTTMIRKVVVSSKFAHVKEEMNNMAEIMTHDKGVQDKIYIKNS